MPLSEHEQRLLDQIERALYAEDPKFASTVRSTDLKTHLRRRLVRAGVALVAGLLVLVIGVAVQVLAVGIAGFLLMLAGGLVAVRSVSRLGTKGGDVSPAPRPARPARPSWRERIDERWRRRWEDRE